MNTVGFSTSCLYGSKRSLPEIAKLYSDLGADALEVTFGTYEDLYTITDREVREIREIAKDFTFVSMHAPFTKALRYGNNMGSIRAIERMRFILEELRAGSLVVHPDRVDSFRELIDSELPFTIENTGLKADVGQDPEYFAALRDKVPFKLVLDLQHAYETTPQHLKSNLWRTLMEPRLSHLHVSGQTQERRHQPVYRSNNQREISQALECFSKETPVILEGIVSGNVREDLEAELKYVRAIAA